jgi:hypothetical protein
MADDKEQKRLSRFTDAEKDLIRNTFKDREDLLKVLRKMFFQFELSAVDLSLLQLSFKNKELLKVLRRLFLPELEADLPITTIGGQMDPLVSIPVNQLLPEGAVGHIKAVDRFIKYIDQQLRLLEDGRFTSRPEKVSGKTEGIRFSDFSVLEGKTDMDIYLDIFARSIIVQQVEKQLNTILAMSEEGKMTDDEIREIMQKNSSK